MELTGVRGGCGQLRADNQKRRAFTALCSCLGNALSFMSPQVSLGAPRIVANVVAADVEQRSPRRRRRALVCRTCQVAVQQAESRTAVLNS